MSTVGGQPILPAFAPPTSSQWLSSSPCASSRRTGGTGCLPPPEDRPRSTPCVANSRSTACVAWTGPPRSAYPGAGPGGSSRAVVGRAPCLILCSTLHQKISIPRVLRQRALRIRWPHAVPGSGRGVHAGFSAMARKAGGAESRSALPSMASTSTRANPAVCSRLAISSGMYTYSASR